MFLSIIGFPSAWINYQSHDIYGHSSGLSRVLVKIQNKIFYQIVILLLWLAIIIYLNGIKDHSFTKLLSVLQQW